MPIIILPCKCKSDFQDREYGLGLRLFNIAGKKGEKARCTVCAAEQFIKRQEDSTK